MKTSPKKFVAAALCASVLFGSGIYAVPALAAEKFSEQLTVTTIPEVNAYMPSKKTVL